MIYWLTGYDEKGLRKSAGSKFREIFRSSAADHENVSLIKGVSADILWTRLGMILRGIFDTWIS
ncbi:hypothetical protein HGB47_15230 [Leptospira yasudae]|uniref:hypothetical protein n=1 Tax=Leptospira yasudae TaxID=2202201 RepID=UPI00384E4451|nr:hypothetical protein [Leptospira yasudae]